MNEKLIEKIKKLLALSKSDNPNEAASALQKAQELMQENDITMGHLALTDITDTTFASQFSISRIKAFEANLVLKIAEVFCCEVLWKPSSSVSYGANPPGSFHLIGPKNQIQLAEYTCIVFTRKLKQARAIYKKKLKEHSLLQKRELIDKLDSFCLGWSQEVICKVASFAGNPDIISLREIYKKEVLNFGELEDSSSKKLAVHNKDFLFGSEEAKKESILRPTEDKQNTVLKITGEVK